jgi:cobalamin 5''-phosphate synthase/cobalamin synthase
MKIVKDLLAALTFFTRLPVWKLVDIPSEHFKRMIYWWPLAGWLTGGITVAAWFLFSHGFPPLIAIILAFGVRTLFTGGFHEDGLGDFFDGFGGGRTKADILRIMKDSQVGSYALLGLIFYYLLLINTLNSLPSKLIPIVIFTADPLSKFITTIMMNVLPYARPESDSKSKTTYKKLSVWKLAIAFATGTLPLIYCMETSYFPIILIPAVTMLFVLFLAKKKIQGYTGDICGATALLCELSFYLGILLTRQLYNMA